MTAPLTPPDCDLQDFPFMPLHVARLRDSDLAAEAAPEACWYAVLLWAASWHQIPAASLPDNDATLARLIGLGRDVRTFRKHKADAMRGFILCDDARLYHPVVAEQANESWRRKLEQRWRTECARIKKANQRHDTDHPTPTFEAWLSTRSSDPSPAFVPEDTDDCPSGQRLQETGTGTETGTGRFIEPPTPPAGGCETSRFDEGWNAYPIGGRGNRGPAKAEAEWPGAVERAGGEARLISAIKAHAKQAAAGPKQTTKAFDRWLRDDGFAAYLTAGGGDADDEQRWGGPRDIWLAIAQARSPRFANTWLADCDYADGVLASRSTTTIRRLQLEVGPLLTELGVELREIAA